MKNVWTCFVTAILVCLLLSGCSTQQQPLAAINLVTLEEVGQTEDFTFEEQTLSFTLNGKRYTFAMQPLPGDALPDGTTAYYGVEGELSCDYTVQEADGRFTVRVMNQGVLPDQYETDPDTFLLAAPEDAAALQEAGQPLVTVH